MRNLLFFLFSISILSCTQPQKEIANGFFKNSDFIEIYEDDTIYLSFLDTTYSLLSENGIQHHQSEWSIKPLGKEKLLLLGFHNPRVLQILEYSDSSCTLKGIGHQDEKPFILYKMKGNDIEIKGTWKSSKIPPPPWYSSDNPRIWDSIFTNDEFWESEVFEITEDSVKYSFYDNKTAVKFKKPFIQLEKEINAANGRLSVLRPISQNDSTLTLEFYYLDGNHSSDGENKKWKRKLKTVANKK